MNSFTSLFKIFINTGFPVVADSVFGTQFDDSTANGFIIQLSALAVGVVVGGPIGPYADPDCGGDSIDVGAQEDEFPAVFFLVSDPSLIQSHISASLYNIIAHLMILF